MLCNDIFLACRRSVGSYRLNQTLVTKD